MSGIKLHHPSLHSCTMVVELPEAFFNKQPRWCPLCNKEHDRKSVHLKLDSFGDVFVSQEVLDKLRTVFLAGFEISNEVKKPPTQLVGAVEQPKLFIVENKLNGQAEAAPFYKPALTKYESRDRMHKALFEKLKKRKG